MRVEEHQLGDIFAYRYPSPEPDHALLVLHGMGAHGGIYGPFGVHHAQHGVDVWCMDAPGHGRSCARRVAGAFTLEEWVDAAVAHGEHIAELTGLPVFVKGSSLGSAAAYSAVHSEVFSGAIIMGFALPGSPFMPPENPFRTEAYEQIEAGFGSILRFDIERFVNFDEDYGYKGAGEQKHSDPHNTWFYDLASIASAWRYDPPVALADNTKPILFTAGENDRLSTPAQVKITAEATGGPVEVHVEPDAGHQLMLIDIERYSRLLRDWCRRHLP